MGQNQKKIIAIGGGGFTHRSDEVLDKFVIDQCKKKQINFGFLPTALLTIPFAIIAMIIYMLLIDKFVFSYYRIKKSPPVQFAMVSVGVLFVTQAIIRIVIGPSDRRFIDGEKFILKANEFKEITGLNEGITLKSSQAITVIVTVIIVSIMFWFLNKTKTGKSMRAYSCLLYTSPSPRDSV